MMNTKQDRARQRKLRLMTQLKPWPVTVARIPGKGRGLVAKQNLAPGSILIQEEAVVYSLLPAHQQTHCNACLRELDWEDSNEIVLFGQAKKSSPFACSGCKQAVFCSESCRHTLLHQSLCSVWQKISGIAAAWSVDVALLKVVFSLAAKQALNSPESQEDKWRMESVDDLVSHFNVVLSSWKDAVQGALQELVPLLEESLRLHSSFDVNTLLIQACRINANAHACHQLDGRDAALGLFPLISLMNHSCAPNAVFIPISLGESSKTPRLAIRTIRPVAMHEELTVAYVDTCATRAARRTAVWRGKYFWCKCDRCTAVSLGELTLPVDANVEETDSQESASLWRLREARLNGILCAQCNNENSVYERMKVETVTSEDDSDPSDIEMDASSSVVYQCRTCHSTLPRRARRQILAPLQLSYEDSMNFVRSRQYGYASAALVSLARRLKESQLHRHHVLWFDVLAPLVTSLSARGWYGRARVVLIQLMSLAKEVGVIRQYLPEVGAWYERLGALNEALAAAYATPSATSIDSSVFENAVCDSNVVESPSALREVSGNGNTDANLTMQRQLLESANDAYERCLSMRMVTFGSDHAQTKSIEMALNRVKEEINRF